MCKLSMFSQIIHYGYIVIWIGIPILYLLVFCCYKSKKKNYKKAVLYALIMLLLLFIPKMVAYFTGDSCFNCYLNGKCVEIKKEDDTVKDDNKNTTTKSTSSNKTTTTSRKVDPSTGEYKKLSEPSGTKEVIGKSSKGYDIYTIDGVTYVDGFLIVNKTYSLPLGFEPTNTHTATNGTTTHCANCINNDAYKAWTAMKADALAVGLNLWIQSGYRPYELQKKLYDGYVSRSGKEEADTYSARPGYSEHQTGLCFDINNPSRSFNGTKEAEWIAQNCYKYGYIIRYPEGKTDETGYIYESWHVRYVGTDLSYQLYNNGDWITMEDYFGLTSEYKN